LRQPFPFQFGSDLLPPAMARLFDDTPDEILVLVVKFLQTSTLSQTCRRAWQLLQRRYNAIE
jgi:hypothetical protein